MRSGALGAGSVLGPYEIVSLLGSGGMGEVYRARDPRLGRDVAIKVLRAESSDRARFGRFEREARAVGALDHPNVLAVHDVGFQGDVPYVVSELLDGRTLRVHLEGGALPVRKALEYAIQIAHGLAAAHDKGLVHRDIKPDNVFITNDGRVKILDFGLARLMRPRDEQRERTAPTATEEGAILGTPGFMSPEQVRGETVDHRSDIFSLGAVLYEMLSGHPAFRRNSGVETHAAILRDDPPPLAQSGRGIPPGLARIVERCLEKRAGDRFHSAHDLALALEAASSGLSDASLAYRPAAGLTAHVAPAGRRWRTIVPALAVTLIASGGLYRLVARSPPPPAEAAVIDSIAVLPFENASGDPDSEYLSDGVAESLINRLARLPDLRVIARTTTFRFKGSRVDPLEAGRELQVGAVVAGRVQLRGDRLVISAELVDITEGTQLWGERYDTEMGGIFDVEEDIASDIVRGLRLTLAPVLQTRLTRRDTDDPEAYRFYLLSRKDQDPFGARAYAEKAITADPGYALAYVARGLSYFSLGQGGLLPYDEAFSKAKPTRSGRSRSTRASRRHMPCWHKLF